MKEVVLINDIAAIASCTLGVSMPILSVCDCKPYPVPTAVFTSSTRVEGFACTSLSGFLPAYAAHWRTLPLHIDGVMAGCFADAAGVNAAIELMDVVNKSDTLVIVDPVMGDDGHLFASDEHLAAMRRLVAKADIICPNFTEFCALLGLDYAQCDAMPMADKMRVIQDNAATVTGWGISRFVITGIRQDDQVVNVAYDSATSRATAYAHRFYNRSVCGTGDMFSSILFAGMLMGKDFLRTVRYAGEWIMNLAMQDCAYPERGLFIGGERLIQLRADLMAL